MLTAHISPTPKSDFRYQLQSWRRKEGWNRYVDGITARRQTTHFNLLSSFQSHQSICELNPFFFIPLNFLCPYLKRTSFSFECGRFRERGQDVHVRRDLPFFSAFCFGSKPRIARKTWFSLELSLGQFRLLSHLVRSSRSRLPL